MEQFLCSNRTPATEEEATFRKIVNDYDDRVSILDNNILELEDRVRHLKDEKNALLDVAAPYRTALSPFRRLPADVIREILVACIDTEINPSLSITKAPMLLTRISGRIREIALTTPMLWAAIHIPVFGYLITDDLDTAKGIMDKKAMLIKEWLLRRSGSVPLRISVREANSYGEPVSYLSKDVMDIVLSCCGRWRNIDFEMSPDHILSRLEDLTPADVPLLQSFYVNFKTINVHQSRATRMDLGFLENPNMQRLGVYSTEFPKFPAEVVNWINITDLALPGMLWADDCITNLAHVLRKCTSLVSLHLAVTMKVGSPIDDIYLPHLRFIWVQEGPDQELDFPGILGVIRAPDLNTIVYDNTMPISSVPTTLIALLQRAPNVIELSLGQFKSTSALHETLRRCPRLVKLRINAAGLGYKHLGSDDEFMAEFYADERVLCPMLEYLSCGEVQEMSVDCLRALITQKNGTIPSISRWKSVKLDVLYDLHEKPFLDEILTDSLIAGIRLELGLHRRQSIPAELTLGSMEQTELERHGKTSFVWPLPICR